MKDCIFCKIARKEAEAFILHEDEFLVAFLDINPVSEGHLLVVPKEHYDNIDLWFPEDTKYNPATKDIRKTDRELAKHTPFGRWRTTQHIWRWWAALLPILPLPNFANAQTLYETKLKSML